MGKKIEALNAAFLRGTMGPLEYEQKARALLAVLDWQHRIKWLNMLFVTL